MRYDYLMQHEFIVWKESWNILVNTTCHYEICTVGGTCPCSLTAFNSMSGDSQCAVMTVILVL